MIDFIGWRVEGILWGSTLNDDVQKIGISNIFAACAVTIG